MFFSKYGQSQESSIRAINPKCSLVKGNSFVHFILRLILPVTPAERPHFSCHKKSFRFILWQTPLRLLDTDPGKWFSAWTAFHKTYTSLITECRLEGFLNASDEPWLSTEDEADLSHVIHIDVVRLSRYATAIKEYDGGHMCHFRRMERILYLFSRCNFATGYHQGYHELLAPLYYVALEGGGAFLLTLDAIESICYFMLHGLVNGGPIGDLFLDPDRSNFFAELVRESLAIINTCGPKLSEAVCQTKDVFLVLAFSWSEILFTQIYALPELLCLWDMILDLGNSGNTLATVLAAHVIYLRENLIAKSFSDMMKASTTFSVPSSGVFMEIVRTIKAIDSCLRTCTKYQL
jgi:hypothetical protein